MPSESRVTFVTKKFASKSEVLTTLTQKVVINCTGLGARTLWNDPKMSPIKGQLAMLPAQPGLQYLYGQDGYMFPRADHVVIGTNGYTGPLWPLLAKSVAPVFSAMCQNLVDHIAALFGKAAPKPMMDIHIHHPENAPVVEPALPGAGV